MGKNTVQAKESLDNWYAYFKCVRTSTEDAEHTVDVSFRGHHISEFGKQLKNQFDRFETSETDSVRWQCQTTKNYSIQHEQQRNTITPKSNELQM